MAGDRVTSARAAEARLRRSIEDMRARIARRRAVWAKARQAPPRGKGKLAHGWFRAWSERAEAMAQDVAALDRLLVRLASADQKIATAKRADAKVARKEAFVRSMSPHLDVIRADAPAVAKRWKKERREEEARLKKRRAALQERHSIGADYDDLAPVDLPPPIVQAATGGAAQSDDLLPPRAGLIPGTYRVLDLLPLFPDDQRPLKWTWRAVGRRLIDAFATLRALPEKDRPSGIRSVWPSYRPTAADLKNQRDTVDVAAAIRSRPVRQVATASEIEMMDEALEWLSVHCSRITKFERLWLMTWCDDPPEDEVDDTTAPRAYFKLIADALDRASVVVR